jgi:hypothetical protein
MGKTLRHGLLKGLFAGFLASLLFVVDYGPANSLRGVASWLALNNPGTDKLIGFLLLLLFGAAFGGLFGLLESRGPLTLGRALVLGLLTGALWWLLVVFGIGTLVNHLRLDFGSWLLSFIPLLVYGLLLGSLSFQWRR